MMKIPNRPAQGDEKKDPDRPLEFGYRLFDGFDPDAAISNAKLPDNLLRSCQNSTVRSS